MYTNIERSEPIRYNDMTVTIPGGEAEIFKAVRHDDISMMRNQLKLNVDMNILHTGKLDYCLKNLNVQFILVSHKTYKVHLDSVMLK